MSTFSEAVDKLCTVNNKLFICQDELYKIRRMTEEEFLEEYSSIHKMKELYTVFKKACDLNVNRNVHMFDLDKILLEMVDDRVAVVLGKKEDMPGKHAQDSVKMY